MYKKAWCTCKIISPFSLPSPSLLHWLPLVVIQRFCYHGNVTSLFSVFHNVSTWVPTEPLVFGILHHILPKKNQRNPLFYWFILIYVITTVFVFLFNGNSDIFKGKLRWWRELIGCRFSKIVKCHRDCFKLR